MKYKFKKGSEVEVWSKREVPSGSWCCAEIISGNGHTYSVRYFPYTLGGAVERVSRKAIRPCPPLVKDPSNWVSGDTLEVFDKYSWKTAEVVRVLGKGYYLVRLLGSSAAFSAHTSALRFRQSWQDDKWVVKGKDMEISTSNTGNMLPKEGILCHQMPQQLKEVKKRPTDYNFQFGNYNDSKEYYQGLSRGGKKRSHLESSQGVVRKMRAVGEERRCQRLVTGQIPKLLEKVDAVASPRTMLGGKHMYASLNNRRPQYFEEELPAVESRDSESISSSVGSCSARNSPYRFIHPTIGLGEDLGTDGSLSPYRFIHPTIGLSEDLGTDGSLDDAEAFPLPASESLPPTKEAVAAEIHRLELHAYRTTLSALHASGSISWEQEALISNLRLMLNISTDEHLLEIRRLIAVEKNGALG